ncbi:hypothetical protein F443_05755 [Phytophthora nicotianae P1569]|uniref:Uncharacterized protein n=1 Tax=Phytophthora nicotianae P1569 TaxID=1317065 RepID=V9FJ01_PHYNI|nr:hypothetical protein F443_05755 [Phytophthora nicotianae P1569]
MATTRPTIHSQFDCLLCPQIRLKHVTKLCLVAY